MTYALTWALLGVTFYATGYLAQRAAPALSVPALGAGLVRVALGLAIWMLLLFVLACTGSYRAEVALPIGGAAIAAAALLAAVGLRQRLQAPREATPPGSRSSIVQGLLLALPAFATLLSLAVLALTPFLGWDDNVYHLTLPKLYLASGGFRRVAFNVYSNWPHGVELLYGLAMMLHDHVLAKLVHTGLLAVLVVAVYRVCRHHGSRAAAFAATVLLLGNHVVLAQADRAYVDVACAFFFLVAVVAADDYLGSRRTGALVLAGIACGALAASKLTGVLGAACIAVLLLSTPTTERPLRRLLVAALALGVPVLLFAVPWYVKSWVYTGNPVYPLLHAQFGGPEWSPELGAQFTRWHFKIGPGRRLFDYLALPYRVATQNGNSYERFGERIPSLWVAAVPFGILVLRWAPAARSYLICAGVYFVGWALGSQQMRFLIPILPLLAIAVALGADRMIALVSEPTARARLGVALAACALFISLPTLVPFWSDGRVAARKLRREGLEDRAAAVPEGYRYLNEHTPATAKVMLLHTNLGYFLDREYIADSFFEASQMGWLASQAGSVPELASRLHQLGITHVYAGKPRRGVRFPKDLQRMLADRHYARRVYRCKHRRCNIYELRGK